MFESLLLDLTKTKTQPPLSESLIKETISGLVQDNSIVGPSLSTYSNESIRKPSSIETNTSSFSPYNNMSVVPLPSHLTLPTEEGNQEESAHDNTSMDNKKNDCNIPFTSSNVETKESSSEASTKHTTDVSSISAPISCKRKSLEVENIVVLDPSKATNSNVVNLTDSPKSPTTKQYPIYNTNSKSILPNSYKAASKILPAHSCYLCNVIVNSAAQLTQVVKCSPLITQLL